MYVSIQGHVKKRT